MKLFEILNEIDAGDLYLAHMVDDRRNRGERDRNSYLTGFWLIDPTSGKKITGPFKDKEAALRFKANRPDKVPANAVVKPL
jgi:hypothetical protein